MSLRRIALIGYGEVGRIFARDLAAAGLELTTYDIAFERGDERKGEAGPARACASHPEAAAGAELVISAVTAAATLDAARATAPGLDAGAFFLDLNSASPGMKRAAAAAVDAAGGRYVEAAVMTSVPPKGVASRMLLGGPHAADLLPLVAPLGFDARVFSDVVGEASATKMCRSVLIKGVEALLMESLVAARQYGVEKTVLASLSDLLPHPDWERQARYMISRSLEHGRRRAEEMREVARTIAEAGVEPLMSEAAAERQDWAADRRAGLPPGVLEEADLAALLDAVAALRR
jgi:3-hydroxyisobutyrate dehydrogenase